MRIVDETSTLEARLRDVLERATAGATTGVDLAAGARARAGARRRSRWAGAGVAAVVAVCLGLGAVIVEDPPPAEAPPTAEDRTSADQERDVPAGWHLVRARGVSVHVPSTWGSGALAAWCRRGPLLGTPVVERHREAGAERCTDPALGYGVQFLPLSLSRRAQSHEARRPRPTGSTRYPEDAWVGVACGGCDVAVRVVAPDLYVARYLLGSYDRAPDPAAR